MAGGIRAGLDTCWFNRRGETPPDGMAITYTVSSLSEIPSILLS
jgi:FMN phosphatase YigB (HAD superfamily)